MIHADWALLAQIIVASEAKQPSIIYFDWTLLYQAGLFLVLMVFLGKVLFAPMLKVFEAREQAHLGPEKMAKDLEAQALAAADSYNKLRLEALNTAEKIRSELLKDATERQKGILAESRQKAEAALKEARGQIEASWSELKAQLPSKADTLAMQLTDKLLGR
jgi:F-type H+-transporting ATPase subunit b